MALTPHTVALPRKVKGKSVSQSEVSGEGRGVQFRADNNPNLNQAVRSYRGIADATSQLRELNDTDGLVSAAITSLVRIADSGLKFSAYSTGTNEFSREGVLAAESIAASFDTLWDYTAGYSDKPSLNVLSQDMLLEAALAGGVGGELVLDKAGLPDRILPINYSTIKWISNGKGGRVPTQKRKKTRAGQSADVVLDLPTIWVSETLKPQDRIYGMSYMIPSLKRLMHYDEFIEDMRRVIRQNGAPRLLVKLDYDAVRSSAPPAVQNDPEKLQGYMQATQTAVEDNIKNLSPEDSLVYYDLTEVDSIDTAGEKKDYKDLLDALSGLAASAMKSNPSILGLRLGGSQNTASTESMLFTHMAGLLQKPVEQVLSRAMTLAVRLYGVDAYVKVSYVPIDLRPKMELEGHKAILQRRAMELLSTGRLTGDEAQDMMGLGSLPDGAPELSGTFFLDMNKQQDQASPDTRGEQNGRQITPEKPASEGGKDNQRRN